MDQKTIPNYMLSTTITLDLRAHINWKWRDGKKGCHANGNQKKSVVAIFTLYNIDFESKTVTSDKEIHYVIHI